MSMARKQKDVFGFDELQKSFEKIQEKYPDTADAVLDTLGRAMKKRTAQLTPIYKGKGKGKKPGQLKRSWRFKKVKLYKGGTVRVVRVDSTAPHGHLVEQGHDIWTTDRRRDKRGRYATERKRAGKVSQQIFANNGGKKGNRVEGKEMLKKTAEEFKNRFEKDIQKVVDNLTKELEV